MCAPARYRSSPSSTSSVIRSAYDSPEAIQHFGNIEIGAAWKKVAKETGREYHSLKLDDPSFPAPIYASLVENEDGYALIWSR